MGYLGDRATSSFPLSIGTAIALEACFDPVSEVYKPEREMPKRIDLTKYNTVLIIYISVMGSIHGLFFTLYLILAFPCRKICQWDDEDSVFALLAAFFPLATIWIDKKLAKFERE